MPHFKTLLNKPMSDITPWEIERWRKKRHEKGIKPITTNGDIAVLKACIKCTKHHGQPMQQLMDNLPKERVEATQPPFTYVGPFNVKFRRGTAKRYGCLFTCLVTRAVHVEIDHSLDSDGFIMALHRFIARRSLYRCQILS